MTIFRVDTDAPDGAGWHTVHSEILDTWDKAENVGEYAALDQAMGRGVDNAGDVWVIRVYSEDGKPLYEAGPAAVSGSYPPEGV